MYFGRKIDGKKFIYKCEILNETEGLYEVNLVGTNENRCVVKSIIGIMQSDGIYAKTKKQVEEELDKVEGIIVKHFDDSEVS